MGGQGRRAGGGRRAVRRAQVCELRGAQGGARLGLRPAGGGERVAKARAERGGARAAAPEPEEVAEALWVHNVSRIKGWPNAVIGYVDFSSENCRHTIKELAKLPLMRGIRQQLHWHNNPLYRFATDPDIMMNSAWRDNFSLLQDHDWCFELQVFASQMKNSAKLATTFPHTRIILQHCGMPEDTSRDGMSFWLDGMKYLADCPNVYCKFSGLGTFLHKNSPSFISDILGQCIELFGAHRCIFGSNFPIEKIWTNYSDLIGSFKHSLSVLSQGEQNLIFYENAKDIYKIDCQGA